MDAEVDTLMVLVMILVMMVMAMMMVVVAKTVMVHVAEQERAKDADKRMQRLEKREEMADKAEEVTKMAVTVFHCKQVSTDARVGGDGVNTSDVCESVSVNSVQRFRFANKGVPWKQGRCCKFNG